VLDNGRFMKARGYKVEGDRARILLDNGGALVLPLLSIDRVLDDEIEESPRRSENAPVVEPAVPFYLGFEEQAQAPTTPYGDFIFTVAKRRNVNPALVAAIVRAESAFDPLAVSAKGARGLMQLMPATGKRFGTVPEELFDAEINIVTGVRYLEQLIDRYDDLPLVLAAYNAGENAVERHRGVPPFRETRDYIRKIYSFLGVDPSPEPAPGK